MTSRIQSNNILITGTTRTDGDIDGKTWFWSGHHQTAGNIALQVRKGGRTSTTVLKESPRHTYQTADAVSRTYRFTFDARDDTQNDLFPPKKRLLRTLSSHMRAHSLALSLSRSLAFSFLFSISFLFFSFLFFSLSLSLPLPPPLSTAAFLLTLRQLQTRPLMHTYAHAVCPGRLSPNRARQCVFKNDRGCQYSVHISIQYR